MLPDNEQPPRSRAQAQNLEPRRSEQYNTLAVISLVCGLLSWLIMPILGAVVAVVCGHLAREQLRHQADSASNTMALVGLIIGYAQLVLFVLLMVGVILFGWAIIHQLG